ncbi:MAG: MaoC family dehydratase N-terminal domain-containing protein [Dehalococcoidales bacterium]|nr:MaoC family dehydratase N-terminal domain-containing protein [Dehalococcoidales bacterium]
MEADSVITEELNSLLNKEFGPEVYEIEKGMLKKFAEAINDPNPRWLEEAPPTFPAALVPKELLNKLFNADIPLKRLLNGSSELEYLVPIKAGDVISVTAKLTRLRQVKGAEGPTLFMFTEMTYTNQRGEVAVKGKNTYVKY